MRAASPDDRGQATVEFALLLPFVAALAACIVVVTAACLQLLALNDLARNCARAAAVSSDPAAAATATARNLHGDVSVTTGTEGTTVTVRVRRWFTVSVPFVGQVRLRTPLSAGASMLLEPPDEGVSPGR
ncbi:MAG: TadE/TadG family type IV pilus assembly protein [Acidimicrobiales bacterium]